MKNKDYDELKVKYDALVKVAKTYQWMAKRYATGRQTFAAQMCNEATQTLLDLGIEVDPFGNETIWALDGGGREYDHLSLEAATPGTPEALGKCNLSHYDPENEIDVSCRHDKEGDYFVE